jgi:hypothetical protein
MMGWLAKSTPVSGNRPQATLSKGSVNAQLNGIVLILITARYLKDALLEERDQRVAHL